MLVLCIVVAYGRCDYAGFSPTVGASSGKSDERVVDLVVLAHKEALIVMVDKIEPSTYALVLRLGWVRIDSRCAASAHAKVSRTN